MPSAVIIGASRGIGREFVRQLLADSWKVTATARDDASIAALNAEGAEAIKLDVARPESLAGLGWRLDGAKVDLAVYVAGVYGPPDGAKAPPSTDDFDAVMHPNVLGVMHLIPMVAPMVEAATGKFMFITSGMGSISEAGSSEGWVYRVSKAALNMAVKSAAYDYPKATFVAMSPGWVRTNMGGPSATLAVDESVSGMLQIVAALTIADTGTFRNYAGRQLAW
jgi:NAD(P)-dependent dehydrogenase (short-subunit alcohol dehydrogenase family)